VFLFRHHCALQAGEISLFQQQDKLGNWVFSVSALIAFNDLPTELKTSPNFVFKRKLKTILFSKAYGVA
jgi:hypothetical protein